MDYNINASGEESLQQYTVQYQYTPVYRRPWFWAVFAAALICVTAAAALLVFGAPGRRELTGNAGVAAAYDFFCTQQSNQKELASPVMKELGERLKTEPFEIEGEMKVSPEGTAESFFSIDDTTIGLEAKYDMKDFGVKVRVSGMEVIAGYLIEDNVVISMMGRVGSFKLNLPDGVKPAKNMGLWERIDAFFPFLPDDGVCLTLLEKFAHSVPDECTSAYTAQVYSPKDDKEVRMDVIMTTLDSKGLKEVITGFANGIKSDKKLLRQLQDIIDKFTAFAGLEPQELDGFIKELEESADSEILKDIKVSWSVYKRHGSYVGIGFEFSAGTTNVKYAYMSEYDESGNFTSTTSEVNGIRSEGVYEYSWQGGKLKMSGESKTIAGEGAGNTMQIVDGVMEFSKNGGNEYTLTGDFTIEGNIYNGILNSQGGESYGMKIEAAVKAGGGLGTLKKDRKWKGIFDKEWGGMEDVFGWLFPDYSGSFDYGIGNKL